jgi:hypothetical protein
MKKTEGYSHAKADARRNKRRIEAEQRQARYDVLTHGEKVIRATNRPGNSKRERARLNAMLPERTPGPTKFTKLCA